MRPPTINWSPLARNVIVGLFVIYVVQLLSRGLVEQWLAWQPLGQGFYPWQPITAFILSGPSAFGALITWVVLYFMLDPLMGMMGARRFGYAMLTSWAFGVVAAFVGVALGATDDGYLGQSVLLSAMFALFGFLRPDATILLMFVIPLQAKWIAWGTGLLTFLTLLAQPGTTTLLAFFCWVGAWVYLTFLFGGIGFLRKRISAFSRQRSARRFEVLDGGKKTPRAGKDDWVN
jgi:hypothetical protein